MAESDFGGWAKITCSDAAELARIVPLFSRRTLEERVRMLLVLFASQSRDGTVDVGYRTLAERAGVTVGKAQRFMAKLKDEGILVDIETVKNRAGEFTIRRFDWVEGDSENRITSDSKTPGKTEHPRFKKRGKSESHQSTQSTQKGVAVDGLTPVAAPQDPNEDELFAAIERRKRRAEQLRIERMGGEASANS